MTTEIRQARRWDLEAIVELLSEMSQESQIQALKTNFNMPYVNKFLLEIMAGRGCIWLAENDQEEMGILIALRVPNIWNPEVMGISEIAYYLRPQYRSTTLTAGRLFHTYNRWADQEVQAGRAAYITYARLPDSNYDPERVGYHLAEQHYLKERTN